MLGANVVQLRNIKKSSLELVHALLKAARKLRNIVLVKFTSSLVVLLGRDLEVCGSTPTVSQTQLAARYQTGKPDHFTT